MTATVNTHNEVGTEDCVEALRRRCGELEAQVVNLKRRMSMMRDLIDETSEN